ncbi:MAG: homocitrate synthase [Defluviitoga tunisiensis]|jgi:homocitrate synthase NifV|uniref:Homocitrate synthase n=1 Tax=Defluviitoga tunisiensis TaxID=1006576 RepID=A0A0C7NLI4_DEFTU|nr:homocitrate synthase [Defluviitoga tunisiensis]MDD3600205.1 homocitrate synthase [Defluviitoga tunisiensis]MDY0379369.1 homocitrate synthase [Defluviitoga tunisiensis]CEP78751.1 2-isopropylmalate synthase [Defluviitoga tunisiensis]HOB54639.1 homocitrate synthase [Defluviitoga tunisiensis]HOK15580.1 homocitrate synthase [Defluviitoga tunisiensis]
MIEKGVPLIMKNVFIVDTTLRDGEQTAGVVFANEEKVQIAKMLAELGVYQIEAGIPTMGGDEKEAIKKICSLDLGVSVMGWNRAVISDIDESLDCGVDAVAISISTSDIHIKHKLKKDREWVLQSMVKATQYAKKSKLYVSVNAEDASRSDMKFLLKFAKEAKEAGADRLRYCDTVGMEDPFSIYERIKIIIEEVGIDVETHTHDDFGMATANTLAGIKAGAKYAGVTVNGLGERAGNAALEEVIMALKYIYKLDLGIKTEMLREICEYVSSASGRPLPLSKAIVGHNVFTHESGIHTDGVLKDSNTYESFSPEEVGLQRQILIGKHSGKHAIIAKFKEYGIELTAEESEKMLEKVRALSVQLKRSLFDKELMYLYKEMKEEKGNNAKS